jgi:hypothetical protein
LAQFDILCCASVLVVPTTFLKGHFTSQPDLSSDSYLKLQAPGVFLGCQPKQEASKESTGDDHVCLHKLCGLGGIEINNSIKM